MCNTSTGRWTGAGRFSRCGRLLPNLLGMLAAASGLGWTPLSTHDDPLVRMPGTQPGDGVVLEAPRQCLNCHDGYDPLVDPGSHWMGSMMGQAARDPLLWSAMTVAAQDSIAALGRPNAADLCLRCHMPAGWLEGRSEPANGTALTGADFDGVTCDTCHRQYDPFFASVREGTDWTGYWDEADVSASNAATTTQTADLVESQALTSFDDTAAFDGSGDPVLATWTEAGAGQFFMAGENVKRASFADANPNHSAYYSRFHKSRYFCASCHDVSNPALANLANLDARPGDPVTLPSEESPAHGYYHVERTFSEFALSAFGAPGGAVGTGDFAPEVFETSRPDNAIASCQDCHMPDVVGRGCNKTNNVPLRPNDSTVHPKSGHPLHDFVGANAWVPWLLASAVPGSPVYDAYNAARLSAGPAVLTLDLTQGVSLDAAALLSAQQRALSHLRRAASLENLSYDDVAGTLDVRIVNHTGHKLISGYPEGRRMFLNVRLYASGSLLWEVNPYDSDLGTLAGVGIAPLGANQVFLDALVYETLLSSSLTGESKTFHFVLADSRYKDNRIPPQGFRIGEAGARLSVPVIDGMDSAGHFTAAEYAGGYDDVQLTGLPTGADAIEVRLFYQTTSREYVTALRDEIEGSAATLDPEDYLAQTDTWFSGLRAWGTTLYELWDHNKHVPGAAPVLMAEAALGVPAPCSVAGSGGDVCDDGDRCTTSDRCSGGVCVGTPVACTAHDECHAVGTCDPASGECTQPALDGVSCAGGQCVAGVCVASGGAGGVAGATGVAGAGGMGAAPAGAGGVGTAGVGGGAGVTDTGGAAGTPGSGGVGGTVSSGGLAGTSGTAGATATAGGGGVTPMAGRGGLAGAAGDSDLIPAAGAAGAPSSAGAGGEISVGGTTGIAGGGATSSSGASSGTGPASGGADSSAGGSTTGSGNAAGRSATAGTAGGDDANGSSSDDGGCGCRLAPTPVAPGWLLSAGAVALLLARRRRRRG